MFFVSAEAYKFSSSLKTFNGPLSGAAPRLFRDGTAVQRFSSPCKHERARTYPRCSRVNAETPNAAVNIQLWRTGIVLERVINTDIKNNNNKKKKSSSWQEVTGGAFQGCKTEPVTSDRRVILARFSFQHCRRRKNFDRRRWEDGGAVQGERRNGSIGMEIKLHTLLVCVSARSC